MEQLTSDILGARKKQLRRRPQKDGSVCECCCFPLVECHHLLKFADFGDSDPDTHAWLCANCHRLFHLIERAIDEEIGKKKGDARRELVRWLEWSKNGHERRTTAAQCLRIVELSTQETEREARRRASLSHLPKLSIYRYLEIETIAKMRRIYAEAILNDLLSEPGSAVSEPNVIVPEQGSVTMRDLEIAIEPDAASA
ncbi:MAG: hypothetical protein ACR2OE_17905 [Thermomicrobiales bacterium]